MSETTTDTAYLFGGVEEITGGAVTKYLGVAGLPQAIRVGSVSEALDGSGNVVAAQLYTPYGQIRYTSGAMPTSKGFTGQRADAVSGLDYYGARYTACWLVGYAFRNCCTAARKSGACTMV